MAKMQSAQRFMEVEGLVILILERCGSGKDLGIHRWQLTLPKVQVPTLPYLQIPYCNLPLPPHKNTLPNLCDHINTLQMLPCRLPYFWYLCTHYARGSGTARSFGPYGTADGKVFIHKNPPCIACHTPPFKQNVTPYISLLGLRR
jgi:hypothetical protein